MTPAGVPTWVVLGVALAFSPASARAESEHPAVRVDTAQCADVSAEGVTRVLRIELGTMFVEAPAAGRSETAARVSCTGGRVTIAVDDPVTGKSLSRDVDTSAMPPDARARLVALAIVELVVASWTELVANPTPVVPAAAPPVAPEVRREAGDMARRRLPGPLTRLRLLATFNTSYLFGASSPFIGGGLVATRDLLPWLALGLDVRGEHGQRSVALGTVDVDLFSAGPMALLTARFRPFALRGVVGARIGSARIAGTPGDPSHAAGSEIAGIFWGPFARAALDLDVGRWLTLELATEGGVVALPVKGHTDGGPDVSVAGPWVGGSLGVGVSL